MWFTALVDGYRLKFTDKYANFWGKLCESIVFKLI